MLPFRRVLFPVDYSQPSDTIAPYVASLADHFDAELTLVHAYDSFSPSHDELLAGFRDWRREVKAFEEQHLKRFASAAFPARQVELRVREGEPSAVIHDIQQHEGADLIMMPTRGHGPLRRFLLGSVTSKVLHDVSSVVWTGTGAALEGHVAAPDYRSILCALDESGEAEAVLRSAASLARSYGADLFVVHVVPMPPMAAEIDFAPYRKDWIDAADSRLRELMHRLNIDAPLRILDAPLIEGIRSEALHRKADLLVLGRGESQKSIGRIWSILFPLIRESPCPVLSI